jgi:hypothetical protein
MDSNSLKGTAKATGVITGLSYDPQAEPSECWIATIGEAFRGAGLTPEVALDSALRMMEDRESRTRRVAAATR